MNTKGRFHRVPWSNTYARAYERTLDSVDNCIPRALDHGTWRNLDAI